jgi:hypothetical protein
MGFKERHLLQEDNVFDLSTNERRLLAARIHEMSSEERERLRFIAKRLEIGAKNGLIDGSLAALLAGLGTAAAIGAGPVAAIVAVMTGAAMGVHSFQLSRKEASLANDMHSVMGKKEIQKLTKELEDLIGKPLVKAISFDGKLRLT